MKKLAEVEIKILKARNSGVSFCEMDDEFCRTVLDQIMLRGAAIYGCSLPQTDYFAGFIAEELKIAINNLGFGEMTEEEILLAMRLNCEHALKYPSGIEIEKISFVGNTFNVYFISNVLEKYTILRNHLDRKIQNQIDGYE